MSERIAVAGLWHLGTVTAAVMAAAGHDVLALDAADVVDAIGRGELPVAEPGLSELWEEQRAEGRLRLSSDWNDLRDRSFIWICYDTPLDAEDRPDVNFVAERVRACVDAVQVPATIAISSQMPVGSVAQLETYVRERGRDDIGFAAIPENLRLGGAIAYMRSADRFVAGTRRPQDAERVSAVLEPLGAPIVSMGIESAEMTKHALNVFLATSVVFANEIAALAERAGADAREVEEGLKTDVRIGRRAYVRAGEAFAGGTLARDVGFLLALGEERGTPALQIAATRESNERHKQWVDEAVRETIDGKSAARIAILGLTYKPGTDTLRSSTSVALARRLTDAGHDVVAFDPAVAAGRPELARVARRAESAAEALSGADVAVLMTPWPAFREIGPAAWSAMRQRRLVDPQRFLEQTAAPHVERYIAFGRPRG